jgi:hypothetical protein
VPLEGLKATPSGSCAPKPATSKWLTTSSPAGAIPSKRPLLPGVIRKISFPTPSDTYSVLCVAS